METIVLFNTSGYKFIGDMTPPFGLLFVASMLVGDYNVILIDQRVQRNWKALLEHALQLEPLCVGVTAMTGKQVGDGIRISRAVKNGSPRTRVVWGGIHASLLPEQTLENPDIDAVVIGEGEESFKELAHAFASGLSPVGIPGVAVRDKGRCVIGPQREFMDLGKLPPIPFDLVDMKFYVEKGMYGPTIRLFSSRGCPQRCAFCYNCSFNRRRWRAFAPERVIGKIRFLIDHCGIRHVYFLDDNFFVNLDRALEIARGIRSLPEKITWAVLGAHCSDVTRMDDDYIRELELSRLKELLIGVESGSPRIIKSVRKNIKVDKLLDANRRLAKYHIIPTYSYMSGFPEETDEDRRMTLDLAFRLHGENPLAHFGTVKPFVPFPGTELYDKAIELGFKPPARLEDWDGYSWNNYIKLEIPWVDAEKKKQLSNLYFCSILMNPQHPFIVSRFYTLAVRILRPMARKRLEHGNLKGFWVTKLMWIMHDRVL